MPETIAYLFEALERESAELIFLGGAGGEGIPSTESGAARPAMRLLGCDTTVSGGSYLGKGDLGIYAAGASTALEAQGGTLRVRGGAFAGGDAAFCGAVAASALLMTVVDIDAGTFSCGTGYGGSGLAAGLVIGLDGSASSSGSIRGGSFSGSYSAGLSATGLSTVEVRGGSFLGPIGLALAGSGSVTFRGSGLAYADGAISGVLADGSPILSRIDGTVGPVGASGTGAAVTFSALPTAPIVSFGRDWSWYAEVATCGARYMEGCGCDGRFHCRLREGAHVTLDDCEACVKSRRT